MSARLTEWQRGISRSLPNQGNTKVFPVPSSNSSPGWFSVLIRLAPEHGASVGLSDGGGCMIRKAHNLSFSLANTAAVLGALFIAFALDLERPYWAMFTVFIIAKPISGAVRSKAVYRFVGTAAGAAMALILVPPLVQAPLLLCLAISGWVGVCLYFSLLDRTPRSYVLMLAGY